MDKNNLEEFFIVNQSMEINEEIRRIARNIANNMSLSSVALGSDGFSGSSQGLSADDFSEEFSVFEFQTSNIKPVISEESIELEAVQIIHNMESEESEGEIQISPEVAQMISEVSNKYSSFQEGFSEVEVFYTEPGMPMGAESFDANPEVVAVSEEVEEDEFEAFQSSLEDQSRFTYEETIPEIIELATDVSGVKPNELRNEYSQDTIFEFTNDIKPYEALGDILLGDGN